MAKFKFPLQKVLDHRKVLEDLAQRDFREAEAELRRQEGLLSKMTEDLSDARLRAGSVQSAGGDAAEALKQIHQYTVLQARRIEGQKTKVQEVEKLVESKREILRQKAVDYKIMVRLREKKYAEFLKDQAAKEQKESDELTVLRFDSESQG